MVEASKPTQGHVPAGERAAVVGKEPDDLVGQKAPPRRSKAAGWRHSGPGCRGRGHWLSRFRPVARASRRPRLSRLAGNRVQRLGGVADPHFAALDQVSRRRRAKQEATAAGLEKSHATAELGLQRGEEGVVVEPPSRHRPGPGQREYEENSSPRGAGRAGRPA